MTEFATEFLHIRHRRITLIRSSKRRTLSIEIDHDGVRARAPMRMRERTIREFIEKKERWISQHLVSLAPRKPKIQVRDGAALPFLGERLQLQILPDRRGKVTIEDEKIVLPVVLSHLPLEQSARNKLIRWYRTKALVLLREKVASRAKASGSTKRGSVKVREYKRRWGSCEHNGNLSFNWRIIMAPEPVIDYVVIHELAHLIEFNHSAKFWRLVAQEMPDWKIQQSWLSEHGADLYLI